MCSLNTVLKLLSVVVILLFNWFIDSLALTSDITAVSRLIEISYNSLYEVLNIFIEFSSAVFSSLDKLLLSEKGEISIVIISAGVFSFMFCTTFSASALFSYMLAII